MISWQNDTISFCSSYIDSIALLLTGKWECAAGVQRLQNTAIQFVKYLLKFEHDSSSPGCPQVKIAYDFLRETSIALLERYSRRVEKFSSSRIMLKITRRKICLTVTTQWIFVLNSRWHLSGHTLVWSRFSVQNTQTGTVNYYFLFLTYGLKNINNWECCTSMSL